MKHLFLYILLLLSIHLWSQGTIKLDTVQTTGGTLTACQQINLTPGFSFAAGTNKSLTLTVNPSTCDPYAGKEASLTAGQNYIRTRTYTNKEGTSYLDQIQYFDGLGRPVQTVQRGITPATHDLVSLQEYDNFGRESNSWLPAVIESNNGAYSEPSVIMEKARKSNTNNGMPDQNPYSAPVYEASPLNRVLEQFGPGADWHKQTDKKRVQTQYLTNIPGNDTLNCILYTVDSNTTDTIVTVTRLKNYDAAQLYVTRVEDEDGNASFEFKDKLEQVVLTRQIIRTGKDKILHDTYYVYDDFGNLKAVLPPLLADATKTGAATCSNKISPAFRDYAYLYIYDHRNRCIAKRLPGCHWIYYVYDKADRLIFTQDGEQRTKGEWFFSIPDVFGRVVLSGICKNTLNYPAAKPLGDNVVKAEFNDKATLLENSYTINGVALAAPVIYTLNYYDNYKCRILLPGFSSDDLRYRTTADGIQKIYDTRYGDEATENHYKHKGLLTGTATLLLDGTTNKNYLYSLTYYDYKKQPIQIRATHHLKGVDAEYIAYNFTGQPVQRRVGQSIPGRYVPYAYYNYSYDHAGRLLKVTHQQDGRETVTLADNSYDELGRLKTVTRNKNPKLTTTYAYNVRSWTKSIQGPLFNQTLFYNESYGDSKAQYNGNISAMNWKVLGDSNIRGYAFTYDNLSRLTSANYLVNESKSNYYKVPKVTYDKHGNISQLERWGKYDKADANYGIVDQLNYKYKGNQLHNITDTGLTVSIAESSDFKDNTKDINTAEYAFNTNGAMIKDVNKGISQIQYNSLNLPLAIEIASNSIQGRTKYMYSASGVKLRTIHETDLNPQSATIMATAPFSTQTTDSRTTDYIGNKVYENNTLKHILVDGGYYDYAEKKYYFYLTDHLGNNRVVADQTGTVVQKNHYYPFGMSFADTPKAEQGKQPYKYNGKELDQQHGLNMYDYSARYYEPSIGRFTTVDPLAEKYYSISPYAYCANNPLKFIDPTGMAFESSDPNQWGDLMSHLAGGGSVNSFDTSGWKETEDPKPEDKFDDYPIPPYNNYTGYAAQQDALDAFLNKWILFPKKKLTLGSATHQFFVTILVPAEGSGGGALVRRPIWMTISANIKKGENGVNILYITGSAKTCLDMGSGFKVGGEIKIIKGDQTLNTFEIMSNGGQVSDNNLIINPITMSVPQGGKNFLKINIMGTAVYWASPGQPVSTRFTSKTLNVHY